MTKSMVMRYAIYGDCVCISLDTDGPMTDHPAIAAQHLIKRPMAVGGGKASGLGLVTDLATDRVVHTASAVIWPSHLALGHVGGNASRFDLVRVAGILAMHYGLDVRPELRRHETMFRRPRPELAMTGTTDARHYFPGMPYGDVEYGRGVFTRGATAKHRQFARAVTSFPGADLSYTGQSLVVWLRLTAKQLHAQGMTGWDWWIEFEEHLRGAYGALCGVKGPQVAIRPIS